MKLTFLSKFLDTPLKLLLISIISLIALLVLGLDFTSLSNAKENEHALQQVLLKKESMLAQKIGASSQQTKLNQLAFLNPTEAVFVLAEFCENCHLLLTKIQLAKPTTKITHDTFEISLNLVGDYCDFMMFFNQLIEFSWNIDWQIVQISLNAAKVGNKIQSDKQGNILYPLEIRLKLAIAHQYVITKKLPRLIQKCRGTISPFVIRRYIGRLIEDNKTTDLIAVKKNQLFESIQERC